MPPGVRDGWGQRQTILQLFNASQQPSLSCLNLITLKTAYIKTQSSHIIAFVQHFATITHKVVHFRLHHLIIRLYLPSARFLNLNLSLTNFPTYIQKVGRWLLLLLHRPILEIVLDKEAKGELRLLLFLQVTVFPLILLSLVKGAET